MIKSFACESTRLIFDGEVVNDIPFEMQSEALRKMQVLNAAAQLRDLEIALGVKLEMLTEERAGKHCIRVNHQGRMCFRWTAGHAHDVEIFGYH
ncbi:type II toxin-antitoxin system RelE/ParE family toxin [bacterium]|nr:MAG: type II toxin-antitoxin system RelE/ParE family toxin [bacterium]